MQHASLHIVASLGVALYTVSRMDHPSNSLDAPAFSGSSRSVRFATMLIPHRRWLLHGKSDTATTTAAAAIEVQMIADLVVRGDEEGRGEVERIAKLVGGGRRAESGTSLEEGRGDKNATERCKEAQHDVMQKRREPCWGC